MERSAPFTRVCGPGGWRLGALIGALWAPLAPAQAPRQLDVVEADAFIRAAFGARDASRYDAAAEAYLGVLARLGDPADPDAEAVLWQHLRQLEPLVPPPERGALGLDRALASGSLGALSPDAGERLVRWWREQDDLPATPGNERLHEHLVRVGHALAAFASPRSPPGYDARGAVYVRLGPPDGRFTIAVSPSVAAFDLEVPRSWTRVPENELWVYRSVRRGLHYVFVRPSGRRPFRQGTASELVPPPLRNAGRGRGRLDALLLVMEEIYGQLAVRDPAYGAVFDQVQSTIGGGTAAEGAPAALAQTLLHAAETEDAIIQGARASLAPVAYSRVREGSEPLEAALRWARFRQPDGSTRLAIQWGVDAARLRPSRRLEAQLRRDGTDPGEAVWVSVSGARLGPQGVASVEHAHQRVELARGGEITGSVEVPLGAAEDWTAVQWQVRLSDSDDGTPGRRIKLGTERLPPIEPLPADGLVMSDLQPFVQVGGQARAYPFAALPPDGLALAFEVYGLERDAAGQAQVRVEYEVVGADRTSSGYAFTTDAAVSRELIQVDVGNPGGEGATVVVRVTDRVAGVTVERSLAFTR